MYDKNLKLLCSVLILTSVAFAATLAADELTQRVQNDLVTLGYEPGNTDGEMDTNTTVAIAKYQAEHDMPVTGEVSPLLAGIISAEADKKNAGAGATTATAARDPEELRAAQQACLEQKMAAAQAASKKKRGFGRLLSAVSRTASHTGNYDVARSAGTVYNANATAEDLSAAAKDLGLTEDEVAECQNPG